MKRSNQTSFWSVRLKNRIGPGSVRWLNQEAYATSSHKLGAPSGSRRGSPMAKAGNESSRGRRSRQRGHDRRTDSVSLYVTRWVRMQGGATVGGNGPGDGNWEDRYLRRLPISTGYGNGSRVAMIIFPYNTPAGGGVAGKILDRLLSPRILGGFRRERQDSMAVLGLDPLYPMF